MAEVLRGAHRGRSATVVQYCNDWFMVNVDGGVEGVIVSPTSLRLDAAEMEDVVATAEAGGAGRLLVEFEPRPDGRFVRRPRP